MIMNLKTVTLTNNCTLMIHDNDDYTDLGRCSTRKKEEIS